MDRFVIACNYLEATSECSERVLAYVAGGGDMDRIRIVARSRGGRWIVKWENLRRLGNFRMKTLPPKHPRYRDERIVLRTAYARERLTEDAEWLQKRSEELREGAGKV